MAQSCKWCFTIHAGEDPDDFEPELIALFDSLSSPHWGVYGGAQLERCSETGRLHIQGFCIFETNKRLTKNATAGIKAVHPTAHWEVMHGSLEASEAYCSKESTRASDVDRAPKTWGVRPVNQQGRRNDHHECADFIKAAKGSKDQRMRAVAAEYGHMMIRYAGGIEKQVHYTEEVYRFPLPVWRDWQKKLYDILLGPADDRHILVYIDPVGGAGKSTLTRYFCSNPEVQGIMLQGAIKDMAHMFMKVATSTKVVFFDICRGAADNVDHLLQFAETVKNGFLASPKYDGSVVAFRPPHVVFFANEDLPTKNGRYGGWTSDRPVVTYLSAEDSVPFNAVSTAFPSIGTALAGGGADVSAFSTPAAVVGGSAAAVNPVLSQDLFPAVQPAPLPIATGFDIDVIMDSLQNSQYSTFI